MRARRSSQWLLPDGNGRRRALAALSGLLSLATPGAAAAQDLSIGDTEIKVTETAVFNYHFDNRDSSRINDRYGEWLNRLNVQANNGPFTLQFRLDSALYAAKPDPNKLAADDADENLVPGDPTRPDYVTNKTLGYGRQLSERYINTVYPSKIALSYTRSGVDVTAGDFYAQLGRGMVLAMRKADELAADTTVRGGKVDFKPNLPGDLKFGMTLLGGITNPLRVDEVSGRQLWQATGGAPSYVFPGAPTPHSTVYLANPAAIFAPDLITGARMEGGTKHVVLSVQAAMMERGDAPFLERGGNAAVSRRVRRISNGSISANVPNIADHAALYAEVAFQNLNDPYAPSDVDSVRKLSGGQAYYGLLTAYQGPVTLSLEGKHYDRYFPMMATVATEAIEFIALQYNAVPTTEPITSDTQFEQFNSCVTGGRARLDYRGSPSSLFYASVGRYRTWGEQNVTCGVEPRDPDGPTGKIAAYQNDVWDPIVGLEINFEDNRTHAYASTGVRVDDSAEAQQYDVGGPTTLYYREHWVRYDLVKKIAGPFSVQTAGFHRYRHFPLQAELPWREGENYLSFIYSPKASAAFGYEYTTKGGSRTDYFNGQVQYRISTDKVVRLFVGQTRPALRCVSGVCRQFPAFEGVKLEAVVRFLSPPSPPHSAAAVDDAWGNQYDGAVPMWWRSQ